MARDVDGVQWLHQRRDWLHRRLDDEFLTVRHAALEAARAVRPAVDLARLIEEHLVVDLAARQDGAVEARADLHALDGLDGHQGAGELAVEAAVPLDVAAEPCRQAAHRDLEDTAQGITLFARRLDLLLHLRLGLCIVAVEI